MSVPKQQPEELSLDKNPGKRRSDSVPVGIKIFWKEKISPLFAGKDHHNTIIPPTINHTSWILGAQPGEDSIAEVSKETAKSVHIVSMLQKDERVLKEPEIEKLIKTNILSAVSRLPWFDHGTLSVHTGKNQTVADMRKFQSPLYELFNKLETEQSEAVYCHCMAGRSRSLVETIAFIYFHPDKKTLFDFANWPKEIRDKIPQELQDRLINNPSISDIAKFVKIQRPDVKKPTAMDGDQAGFLGLISLDQNAKNLGMIKDRDPSKLYQDAQNIGLMLKAPLDRGFRDPNDRKEQEKNLEAVYQAYQARGINLLMAMVFPITEQIQKPIDSNTFKNRFEKLKPSEQARFAILLQQLEQHKPGLDLEQLRGKSLEYAKIATKNAKKLTAGDHVELLRTFGAELEPNLGYADVIKKILKGNSFDRYDAGVQLAELLTVTPNNSKSRPLVENAIGKLSYAEQVNFVNQLAKSNYHETNKYAKMVQDNYSHRRLPFFNNPLSKTQIETLADLAAPKPKSVEQTSSHPTENLEIKPENKEEIAIRQFKDFFNGIKSKLTPADKENLVKQFMFDPKNPKNPGNPEKLAIVLSACSKHDLSKELLESLKKQYPPESNTELAKTIATLPESQGTQGWQHRSSDLTKQPEPAQHPTPNLEQPEKNKDEAITEKDSLKF